MKATIWRVPSKGMASDATKAATPLGKETAARKFISCITNDSVVPVRICDGMVATPLGKELETGLIPARVMMLPKKAS